MPSVESDLDRLAFVSDWDIAIVDGKKVNGVFNQPYAEAEDVDGNSLNFTCRSIDIESLSIDETITINNVTYTVRTKESGGTGMTILGLSE